MTRVALVLVLIDSVDRITLSARYQKHLERWGRLLEIPVPSLGQQNRNCPYRRSRRSGDGSVPGSH